MEFMTFREDLSNYLKANKVIYTVRKYKMTTLNVQVGSVGECKREFLKEIKDASELDEYASKSGFGDPTAWKRAIGSFIETKEPKYLYRIEVV